MVQGDSKLKIVREFFPSETISIVGDILAGIVLSLLILPYKSFIILILIVPALLSMRGNISGPFIARTSRDIILGYFNKRSWLENTVATYFLAILISFLIGISSIILNIVLIRCSTITIYQLLFIPIISIIITLSVSIPCSTLLNLIAFQYGLDPNNVVNPVMTAIDDFFTVLSFYFSLLILGVI